METSLAPGLKTPSPEDAAYHKRQDSVHQALTANLTRHLPMHLNHRNSYSSPVSSSYSGGNDLAAHHSHVAQTHHNHYGGAADGQTTDAMPAHQPHASVSSTASAQSYFPQYGHSTGMTASMSYPTPAMSVQGYPNYLANVTSAAPMPGHMVSPPGLPPHLAAIGHDGSQTDPTGQVQPPGAQKPRVTATLWEDEGTICFQVETAGICVARREDNHMINGTKLLNVAGMTRGRRDGMLKGEKHRTVVKIGPMHLKGVWIPYERALELANKEKITDQLYPLFVHNINALLYHGQQPARMASAPGAMGPTPMGMDPRRHDSVSGAGMSPTTPMTAQAPAGGAVPRPLMDRSHSFPAPHAAAPPQSWSDYQVGGGNPSETSRGYTHSAQPSYDSAYGTMAPPGRVGQGSDAQTPTHASSTRSDVDHEGEYTHTTGPYSTHTAFYATNNAAPRTSYDARSLPSAGLPALMTDQRAQGGDAYASNGITPGGSYGGSPDILKRKRTLDDDRGMAIPQGKR